MFASDRQQPEPSPTPLSDRIAEGFAALAPTEGADQSPYWTTSLDRPTGFVPVDLGGPTPEHVAHGLLLALGVVPLGMLLAFTTGRSGSVTVLSAALLALGVAVLYRRGARTVTRRGVGVVGGVVLLGVLLEVVAVAASEASVAVRDRPEGPLGFVTAVGHRLGDPTQTGRYAGATAIFLGVALAVTAVSLVWLGSDSDDGDDGDDGDGDEPGGTPPEPAHATEQDDPPPHPTHHPTPHPTPHPAPDHDRRSG